MLVSEELYFLVNLGGTAE